MSALSPAGHEADVLAEVINVSIAVGTGSLLLALVLLALALWGPRRRSEAPGHDAPAARTQALWLWGGGVALPVLVFGALLAYSHWRAGALDAPPPGEALIVRVTGHMWWWALDYLPEGATPGFTTANELWVPVGRPVRLTLESADVIHSLWVPALGGKMDLVPGRLNRLVFTATRPGRYHGPCAEYCGTQHAHMALQVVAVPPAEFERWRAAQAAPRPAPRGAAAQAGRLLFSTLGCVACHRVAGLSEPAQPGMGPDLTHVATRARLGAGVLAQEGRALQQWIHDAQAAKPGARMPAYPQLAPAELDALAAFLREEAR